MKLKGATSVFGSVGILLPLILITLIATAATYACPGTQTRVVYRTRTVNSRAVPLMGTTVISYGGSARCGDSAYVARPVRYVAVRRSAPRYVAVRNADSYYPVSRVRYVTVRSNDDIDYAPRYVALRRQPAYVESRVKYVTVNNGDFAGVSRYVPVDSYDTNGRHVMRYAAVRSGYRTGNGIVGYVDVNDVPQYVAVRRQPVVVTGTRYVALRNTDSDYDDDDIAPARYVAVRNVRNACSCGVSSLNDVETIAPRHVVVKTDYIAGTQDVIVPRSSYNDTAYMAVPSDSIGSARYVGYSDAAYLDDDDQTYVPASYAVVPRTRTIAYVPTYDDNDLDDQATLDTDNVAYVADNDIGDACLSQVAVQAPMEYSTRTVSYVPVEDVDYDTSLSGSGTTYIMNDNTAPDISYVPVIDDDSDMDTTYVSANDVGASCSCPIASRTFEDNIGYHTISRISADNIEAVNVTPVNYAPVQTVRYVPDENVDYVPADEMNVDNVSYVPAESVGYADTADTDACACPTSENSLVTEPVTVADSSTAIVEDYDSGLTADMTDTQKVAADNGYNDGFEAGKNVALNGSSFDPENSTDYNEATSGYVDTYGDKSVYIDQYRSSYLKGYSAGFNSITSP